MLRIVWQGPQASQILHFVSLAYGHYPPCQLSAHAHNLAQYVGTGRQHWRAGYVLYRALVHKVVVNFMGLYQQLRKKNMLK